MNICRLAGKNIRLYRQKMQLSQEELAARAGMSRPYLAEIESGSKNPSLALLDNIAQALGRTVIDLLR
jgi:transcriptional regulator with XRE-family HTH domain